ncbi:DNA-binding NarL/FixJ family response regulator [Rhodovulum sulfidophilum]|uniref:hypothetical protein n=1 Tax=Rhodovulum sulfidophilum TaxID=35806 RepID=UPI00069635A3|nr:hypothetical protein [Rhodovulum sulfidophilum]ANB35213.1 hypothetical protein A6W98_14735 [Rhodovulum sulfidophilum DSM 1374]ANB39035.1 hypothetical protein A6024_14600 [Rhodovulum sulfidophilum]MCW2303966.1 DNA-binding NarL/FixJ family response regulator [Rhodovulum sulfidophilum]
MSGRPVRSDAAQVRPVLACVFRGYRVPLIDIGLRPGLRLVWLQRFPEGRSGLIAWLRCAGLDVVTVPGLDPAQEEIEGSGRYLAAVIVSAEDFAGLPLAEGLAALRRSAPEFHLIVQIGPAAPQAATLGALADGLLAEPAGPADLEIALRRLAARG